MAGDNLLLAPLKKPAHPTAGAFANTVSILSKMKKGGSEPAPSRSFNQPSVPAMPAVISADRAITVAVHTLHRIGHHGI